MTWYGGELLEKLLSTYSVSPAGWYLGMSPLSWGLAQGFVAIDGHTSTSVRTGEVGREIIIEEVAHERRTVRGLGGGVGTACQNLVRARLDKREFGLEYLGVDVGLHTLADGRGGIVHPCLTIRSEVRC